MRAGLTIDRKCAKTAPLARVDLASPGDGRLANLPQVWLTLTNGPIFHCPHSVPP